MDLFANQLQKNKSIATWSQLLGILNDKDSIGAFINRYGMCSFDKEGKKPPGIIFCDDDNEHFGVWVGNVFNPCIYRGENKVYSSFTPSIDRGDFIKGTFNGCAEIIKKMMFIKAFKRTPYYTDGKEISAFGLRLKFDFEAVAQHYCYPTRYIDVTHSEEVALFFAYTYFENGSYHPIVDFINYSLVIYRADIRFLHSSDPSIMKKISFQVLKRPALQGALAMECAGEIDLKQYFQRQDLPKDPIVSKWIYERFGEGELLWPDKKYDCVYQLADFIQTSIVLDKATCEEYCSIYKCDKDKVYKILNEQGYRIEELKNIIGVEDCDWNCFCNTCKRDMDKRVYKLLRELSWIPVSPSRY